MILFSDFDKTIYFKRDSGITRANIEAVKKWRKLGNKFCITTGRSFRSVTNEMPEIIKMCDYFILDSGSIVLSKDAKFLNTFTFEPEVVSGIIDLSRDFSEVPVPLYFTPDSENFDYKIEKVTKLRLWFKEIELMDEVANKLEKNFSVFTDLQDAISDRKELEGYRGFVEIIPSYSGKNNAIKILQEYAKISNGEIITVGDGLNDYNMIRDFDGYAIEGSLLTTVHPDLKTTSAVWLLVKEICMNNIIIRKAEEKDLPEAVDNNIKGWQTAYAGIIDDEYLKKLPDQREIRLEKMKETYKTNGFLVAELFGKIVGHCRFVFDNSFSPDVEEADCEIMALYVKPDLKYFGIGTKLFNGVLNELKKQGKKKMVLWCLDDNEPSKKFYAKMGGEIIGKKDIEVGGKSYKECGFLYSIQ